MSRSKNPFLIKNNRKFVKAIGEELMDYFNEKVFHKLLEIIEKETELLNEATSTDIELVRRALYRGKIFYKKGYIHSRNSTYNASLSQALKKLGATYNANKKAFSFNITDPALGTIAADVALISERQKDKIRAIEYILLNLSDEDLTFTPKTIKPFLVELTLRSEKQLDSIKKWTEGDLEPYLQTYVDNVNRSIEKLKIDEIEKLRTKLAKTVQSGQVDNETLKNIINYEMGISERRADFIAKQESNLIKAQITAKKAIEAGVDKYLWMTQNDERVRPATPAQQKEGWNHRYLHGKMCSFSNPPITNFITGARANPSEDYGCRCYPILIPPEQEARFAKNAWLDSKEVVSYYSRQR